MTIPVNSGPLAGHLFVERNRKLYLKVRDTYAALPIMSHGWDHVHRCLLNAERIARTEPCDPGIVFPAALLHDIGFIGDPDPAGHHQRGALACAGWLGDWDPAEQQAIAACVYTHKGLSPGFATVPETLEQKIICDADLLEKVGYTGLFQGLRTFAEFGATCWPQYRSLERILFHLQAVELPAFYTEEARRLGEERGGVEVGRRVIREALLELGSYYQK